MTAGPSGAIAEPRAPAPDAPPSQDPVSGWVSPGASGRLRSIDALRGLAALGVVMFHARDVVPLDASRWTDALLNGALWFGRYGVWLFFVISGFCIHLRWAREQLPGALSPRIDFVPFWKRRLWRLYPPYAAALAIYVACLMAEGLRWTPEALRNVGLNLVMLTNVDQAAASAVNGVFWTLAVEEQLYLAYFLLVRWRVRFGWAATLAACLAVRAAWFVVAALVHRTTGGELLVVQAAASQWIIWALGALGVEAALGLVRIPAWCRNGWIGTAILLVAAGVTWAHAFVLPPGGWVSDACWLLSDVVWGLGFFVWVNAAVAMERRWTLGARLPRLVLWCAGLGFFSYSIYLTHEIVLKHLWPAVAPRASGAVPAWLLLLGLTAASVLFARGFFRWCERPFLSSTARRPARPLAAGA